MSNSLRPHGMQHNRLSCPSPSTRVCSDSYLLTQWCHLTISSSVSPPSLFAFNLSQHQGLFQSVGSSHQVAKVFSFSISSSNGYLGLISFITDWFDLMISCNARDYQQSSLAPQFKSISSSALSLLYDPALISVHDYWTNHSFNYTDLCWQSDISAF